MLDDVGELAVDRSSDVVAAAEAFSAFSISEHQQNSSTSHSTQG